MRLILTALLLILTPAAASTTVIRSTPVPGHAAGSFGASDMPFGILAGGVAWAADGSAVFTLDTTRQLKRWRVADGRLLGGQTLKAPAALPDVGTSFPTTGLFLSGAADAYGLPLLARGQRGGQERTLSYRLNTGSGLVRPETACLVGTQANLTCTPDGASRSWTKGNELYWQRGAILERLQLPAGRLAVSDLALSDDGQRLALLGLTGDPDPKVFGGAGVLLTWTVDGAGQVQARQLSLEGPRLYAGATLSWRGERLLIASNVYNTGNEYGSGGALDGQFLALYAPGSAAIWTLGTATGLRGAFPSPDGELFVTIRDGSVPEVRRVSDSAFVRSLGEAVLDAAALSGGRTLLAVQGGGGSGRVTLHQAGSLRTLYRGRAERIATAYDGSRFATVFRNTVRLHSGAGTLLREWQTAGRVTDLAFSPDGQVLSVQQFIPNSSDAGTLAWRVKDGTPLRLPAGTQFPVSAVVVRQEERKDGPQNNYRRRWVVTARGSSAALWGTPWHSGGLVALASPNGRWLAQSGLTPATISMPETGRERSRAARFSRVAALTGTGGPVLSVPTGHPDDPYAGWGLSAFDGHQALLAERSGDGCGGQLYGYKLADLAGGRVLNTPAALRDGYARLMGCGFLAPRTKTLFAPDGRLLIQDGNRLDWWTVAD
jgi:hypothetical protein